MASTPDNEQLGEYELLDHLGGGGMGMVYKARHRTSGEVVAIKIMPPEVARNPIMLKRFEQEFRVASKLDHANVVRALEFSSSPTPYLVMEYVEGEDLALRVERHGAIPEEEALQIIVQVAHGLHRAHRQGLIHRDVKPENILVTSEGKAKLADLGLVKDIDSEVGLTKTGRGLGTPAFMAPEQFSDAKNASVRCDVYSLGATLYQMVTGKPPFDAGDVIHTAFCKMNSDFPPPRKLVPGLSERTDRVICRALSGNPDERPASCREFVEELIGDSTRRAPAATEDEPDFWYVVYTDADGASRTAKGNTQVIRRSLASGALGASGSVRASRQPAGPFEPIRHYPEFRDPVTIWAAPRVRAAPSDSVPMSLAEEEDSALPPVVRPAPLSRPGPPPKPEPRSRDNTEKEAGSYWVTVGILILVGVASALVAGYFITN
jgi:serine/threonine protein kinase